VRGLLNVQFALTGDVLYVLEANPRASRTVPFVSKATGGAAGQGRGPDHARRHDRGAARRGPAARHPATGPTMPVGSAGRRQGGVLPFGRFRTRDGADDSVLGPEMRSTGEVMGIDADFGTAFAKSQLRARIRLPTTGRAVSPSPTGTSAR
jgi:carbamoyl-phosphate synthase large subunit